MDWIQALILGVIQGLTEYLPVSSSGHLAIISTFFGIDGEESLMFTVAVHIATVLSTLVMLWREIDWILKGLFNSNEFFSDIDVNDVYEAIEDIKND